MYSKKKPKECRYVREMRRRITLHIKAAEKPEEVEAKAGRMFTVKSNLIRIHRGRGDRWIALAWHRFPPDPAYFTILQKERDG